MRISLRREVAECSPSRCRSVRVGGVLPSPRCRREVAGTPINGAQACEGGVRVAEYREREGNVSAVGWRGQDLHTLRSENSDALSSLSQELASEQRQVEEKQQQAQRDIVEANRRADGAEKELLQSLADLEAERLRAAALQEEAMRAGAELGAHQARIQMLSDELDQAHCKAESVAKDYELLNSTMEGVEHNIAAALEKSAEDDAKAACMAQELEADRLAIIRLQESV
ncbi:hypothetical protein CYMTET_35348, partial [Cymbomonas tetramitiformis]